MTTRSMGLGAHPAPRSARLSNKPYVNLSELHFRHWVRVEDKDRDVPPPHILRVAPPPPAHRNSGPSQVGLRWQTSTARVTLGNRVRGGAALNRTLGARR